MPNSITNTQVSLDQNLDPISIGGETLFFDVSNNKMRLFLSQDGLLIQADREEAGKAMLVKQDARFRVKLAEGKTYQIGYVHRNGRGLAYKELDDAGNLIPEGNGQILILGDNNTVTTQSLTERTRAAYHLENPLPPVAQNKVHQHFKTSFCGLSQDADINAVFKEKHQFAGRQSENRHKFNCGVGKLLTETTKLLSEKTYLAEAKKHITDLTATINENENDRNNKRQTRFLIHEYQRNHAKANGMLQRITSRIKTIDNGVAISTAAIDLIPQDEVGIAHPTLRALHYQVQRLLKEKAELEKFALDITTYLTAAQQFVEQMKTIEKTRATKALTFGSKKSLADYATQHRFKMNADETAYLPVTQAQYGQVRAKLLQAHNTYPHEVSNHTNTAVLTAANYVDASDFTSPEASGGTFHQGHGGFMHVSAARNKVEICAVAETLTTAEITQISAGLAAGQSLKKAIKEKIQEKHVAQMWEAIELYCVNKEPPVVRGHDEAITRLMYAAITAKTGREPLVVECAYDPTKDKHKDEYIKEVTERLSKMGLLKPGEGILQGEIEQKGKPVAADVLEQSFRLSM